MVMINAWFHPAPDVDLGPGDLRRVEIPMLPRVGDRIAATELNPTLWQPRDCGLSVENLSLYLLVDVPEVFADVDWIVVGTMWTDLTEPRAEVAVVPQPLFVSPGKPVWAFIQEFRLAQEAGPADSEFGEP